LARLPLLAVGSRRRSTNSGNSGSGKSAAQISFNRTTNKKERDLYRKYHSPSFLGKQMKKIIPFKEQRAELGVLKPNNADGPF